MLGNRPGKGNRNCWYQGCTNNSDNSTTLKFHRLPRDSHRRNQWIENVKNPLLGTLSDKQQIQKSICSIHFLDEAYVDVHTRKLKKDAVPQVYQHDIQVFEAVVNDVPTLSKQSLPSKKNLQNSSESEKVLILTRARCGIRNDTGSNICFVNSVIQALFEVEEFSNILKENVKHCSNSECTLCILAHIHKLAFSEPTDDALSMRELDGLLKRDTYYGFTRGTQCDAMSFMMNLITILIQEDDNVTAAGMEMLSKLYNTFCGFTENIGNNVPDKLKHKKKVHCRGKCLPSYSDQYLYDLPLEPIDIVDGLAKFFGDHILNNNFCMSCKTQKFKRSSISNPPRNLILRIKRYTASNDRVMAKVLVPDLIDLSMCTCNAADSSEKLLYQLTSTVNNYGITLDSGHYTAWCSNRNGRGHIVYDDAMVIHTTRGPANNEVYGIIYTRVHERDLKKNSSPVLVKPRYVSDVSDGSPKRNNEPKSNSKQTSKDNAGQHFENNSSESFGSCPDMNAFSKDNTNFRKRKLLYPEAGYAALHNKFREEVPVTPDSPDLQQRMQSNLPEANSNVPQIESSTPSFPINTETAKKQYEKQSDCNGKKVPRKRKLSDISVTTYDSEATSESTDVTCSSPKKRKVMYFGDNLSKFKSPTAKEHYKNIPRPKRRGNVRQSLLAQINETRKKKLTPRKLTMYKEHYKLRRELRRVKRSRDKYKKKCSPFHKTKDLLKELSSLLDPFLFEIIRNKIMKSKHKKKRNFHSLDSKLFCLALIRNSPKAYKLLQHKLGLPSRSTLQRLLNGIPFTTGTNNQLLHALKNRSKDLSVVSKVVSVSWDETKIMEFLQYNERLDLIEGFEDFGEFGRSNKVASEVLVFLMKGLIDKNFVQPTHFFFSKGQTKALMLKNIIPKVIKDLKEAGFDPVVTTCDQGTSNLSALKLLGANFQSPVFVVDNKFPIVSSIDGPHAEKCTRNLLMGNYCFVGGNEVKWQYIKDFVLRDLQQGINRLAPNVFVTHIEVMGRFKMRVFLAVQVLSKSVADGMLTYVSKNLLPVDAVHTISFVDNLDLLFDSINCSHGQREEKIYRQPITRESPHWDLWESLAPWMLKVKFVHKSGVRKGKEVRTPTPQSWVWLINAIKALFSELEIRNIHELCARNMTQCALESFHGMVKLCSRGSKDPTVSQYIGAYKTAIVNKLLRSRLGTPEGANCENDGFYLLEDLRVFLTPERNVNAPESNANESRVLSNEIPEGVPDIKFKSFNDLQTISLVRTSTEVLKVIHRYVKCKNCELSVSTSECSPMHLAELFNDVSIGKLYPSEEFVESVGTAISVQIEFLKEKGHETALSVKCKDVMRSNVDFAFAGCKEHKVLYMTVLEKVLFHNAINRYLSKMNRDIKEERKSKADARRISKYDEISTD